MHLSYGRPWLYVIILLLNKYCVKLLKILIKYESTKVREYLSMWIYEYGECSSTLDSNVNFTWIREYTSTREIDHSSPNRS